MKKTHSILMITISLLLFATSQIMAQNPTLTYPRQRPTPDPRKTRPPVVVGTPVRGEPIRNLAVHIITSTLPSAGTDSDVYFDIGPIGWLLDKPGYNDFESGDDDSYNLPLPSGIQLTTDDIVWLRLQLRGNDTWKPETIELLVNGSVVMHVGVRGLALDSNNWYWVQASFPQTRNYTREAQFAHSLSVMNGNDFHNSITPSTPSWVQGLPLICATGQVDGVFPYPYGGTIDGFVPLWLLVESVQIGDRTYMLNEAQGFYQPRYLMVTWRPSDFPAPRFTQRIRVCGNVQWNRERVGEYILIPRNRTDTTFPGE